MTDRPSLGPSVPLGTHRGIDDARLIIEQEKNDRAKRCLERINEALSVVLREEQCVLDVSLTLHSNGAPNEIRFTVNALDWRDNEA